MARVGAGLNRIGVPLIAVLAYPRLPVAWRPDVGGVPNGLAELVQAVPLGRRG